MKRLYLNLTFITLMAALFSSCLARDIKEQDIGRIELRLSYGGIELVMSRGPLAYNELSNLTSYGSYDFSSSVPPGAVCKLEISVFDRKGEEIKRPDHRNFIISSSNNSFTVIRQDRGHIFLSAEGDGFRMLEQGGYKMTIAVEENPFSSEEYSWDIDWNVTYIISYKGAKGRNGTSGMDGRNGYGSSSFTLDGGDGSDGGNGSPGADGPNVTLIAAYYDISDMVSDEKGNERLLLFYNPETGDSFLRALGPITIDASGGDGGDGGSGGNAGKGGRYTEPGSDSTSSFSSGRTISGKDGKAGSGGNGASGGDGGAIKFLYYSPDILSLIEFVVDGGKPGAAGRGGYGSSFGSGSGRSGSSSGQKGEYRVVERSLTEIKAMLSELDNRYFDINRVVE